MKNRKIAIFFDAILTVFICFFVAMLLLSTLKRSAVIKFILALTLSLALGGVVFIHKRNKFNSIMLTQRQCKELESLMLSLEIMPDDKVTNLLTDLLKRYNVEVKLIDGKLKFNDTVYLFCFNKQLSRDALCSKLKGVSEQIIFFCNSLSTEAEQLLSCVKERVQIIDGEMLFKLMQKVDFNTSELILTEQKRKFNFKGLTEKAFTKKRAFRYAVISATLLLFSRFTFFPTYYKICSATLLFLSALCLVFGKKEKKTTLPELTANRT